VGTSLGRGALVDRGDNGLCVGPVVRSQDQGCVGGWRSELRWGRDERLEVGAFGWRPVAGSVTTIVASLTSGGLYNGITKTRIRRNQQNSHAEHRCQATVGETVDAPTTGSLKTTRREVSSIHLILKPPRSFSNSAKAAWMSRVLSSGGKPERERIRVTQAERDIFNIGSAGKSQQDRIGETEKQGTHEKLVTRLGKIAFVCGHTCSTT
jgi:hypothetical protein